MTRKQISVAKLKPGPIRHESLTLSLIARINYIYQTLAEVYPQSLEVWLDAFRRDANPESEVRWWERLTRCYTGYLATKDLATDQKQALFKVLFSVSMGNGVAGIRTELNSLPDGSEQVILELMAERPQ